MQYKIYPFNFQQIKQLSSSDLRTININYNKNLKFSKTEEQIEITPSIFGVYIIHEIIMPVQF